MCVAGGASGGASGLVVGVGKDKAVAQPLR